MDVKTKKPETKITVKHLGYENKIKGNYCDGYKGHKYEFYKVSIKTKGVAKPEEYLLTYALFCDVDGDIQKPSEWEWLKPAKKWTDKNEFEDFTFPNEFYNTV